MPIISKEKREIYGRKISSFWADFSHNRVGLVGLAIIGLYVFVAFTAPYLSPYPPINAPRVATGFAMPSWATMFPQFSNLPPTVNVPVNWTAAEAYPGIDVKYGPGVNITYNNVLANDTIGELIAYSFVQEFNHTYDMPREFEVHLAWTAQLSNVTYRLEVNITNPSGETFRLFGEDYSVLTERMHIPKVFWDMSMGNWLTTSGEIALARRISYEYYYRIFFEEYKQAYIESVGYEQIYNSTLFGRQQVQARLWNTTYSYKNLPEYTDPNWSGFANYFNNYWLGNDTWPGWNESVSISPYNGGSEFWRNYLLNEHYKKLSDTYKTAFGTFAAGSPEQAVFNETVWNPYYYGNDSWAGFWPIFGEAIWNKSQVQFIDAAATYADPKARADADQECRKISPAKQIFTSQGTYKVQLYVIAKPLADDAQLKLVFSSKNIFRVWGLIHGVLGADAYGKDVFTQLVHGARISLIVGTLAAILATSLELVFGVTAGYLGGITDELTMRIVDVLLCLPTLPLLLALSAYFKPNVYFIVLLIAVFGWQGGARVIRSRILTIREMPFVESARSSGASDSYLIFRHLIPNVFPLAIASMILAVPAAVLTEAALSFLGFGDPMAPTWGKMLNEARDSGAFGRLAWHYILPPGFAITILCVAFVFVGHALDEVVNPRLRRRR